jgi:spore coat protein H
MLKLSSFAVLICLLVSASAFPTTSPDPATGKSDDFFGQTKIYTFHLTIAANDFHKMPPKNGRGGRGPGRDGFGFPGRGFPGRGFPGPVSDSDSDEERYTKVPAKLQFQGKDYGTISLRYKGNSTYMSAPTELKRSLKLDFDDADKTRTFFGMTKLNLNNNAMDSSQMREALAYDVFRRAGVAASRTAYAKVFITVPGKYDNAYAGLFTAVEQVDQTFFVNRWGKKIGALLKPEGLNGMPYLGEDWKSYEKRYVSKVSAKPDAAARLVSFIKFVNQASDDQFDKQIGDYLDVDQFLRFLAAEVVLVNTDSPLALNHNYWLTVHPDSKKVVWVPWDMNMAFGGFMSGDEDLSVHKPSTPGMFPLADRIFRNKALLQRYDQIVREMLTTNFTVDRIDAQVKEIEAVSREAIAAEKTSTDVGRGGATDFFGWDGPFGPRGFGPGGSGPALGPFVKNRVESVVAQLDGKREGTAGSRFGGPGGRPPDFGRGRGPFGPGVFK